MSLFNLKLLLKVINAVVTSLITILIGVDDKDDSVDNLIKD